MDESDEEDEDEAHENGDAAGVEAGGMAGNAVMPNGQFDLNSLYNYFFY